MKQPTPERPNVKRERWAAGFTLHPRPHRHVATTSNNATQNATKRHDRVSRLDDAMAKPFSGKDVQGCPFCRKLVRGTSMLAHIFTRHRKVWHRLSPATKIAAKRHFRDSPSHKIRSPEDVVKERFVDLHRREDIRLARDHPHGAAMGRAQVTEYAPAGSRIRWGTRQKRKP
jgi:hypothetical protein